MDAGCRLCFHAPCFDGIVSCVLALDFLERGEGRKVERLEPVSYEQRETWLANSDGPMAVVDYLFHPGAVFWADHHLTTFLSPQARECYEAGRRDRHKRWWWYDPSASSCASLLWRGLMDCSYRNLPYEGLVAWADKIDSATYDSVEEALFGDVPALRINAGLGLATEQDCVTLVRFLQSHSLNETAELPDVRLRWERSREMTRQGLARLASSVRLLAGDIAVFDVDTSGVMISRYAPYHLHPQARYSVGITRSGGSARITAMRNPWVDFPSVPLGPIFESLGGGGHHRVGTLALAPAVSAKASQVLAEVLGRIRQEESALQSGGAVDQAPPVPVTL
jgi:hypothetical protein